MSLDIHDFGMEEREREDLKACIQMYEDAKRRSFPAVVDMDANVLRLLIFHPFC